MKNQHAWILYTFLGCMGAGVLSAAAATSAHSGGPARGVGTAKVEHSKPRIIDRWADGRAWQRVTTETLTNGAVVLQTNRWIDLATGMHYWDQNHWKESRTDILITPDGAEARQGAHQVRFAGNINTVGAITLVTREKKVLRSHVLGLAYTDLATGESVLIAPVRDSTGLLFFPNQVLYPAAFSGLLADIRYAYSRAGFEQDIILRENPAPPSAYGLNDETTVLEVWTEFVEAPEPGKKLEVADGLPDETLTFGALRMARGGAFALDTPAPRASGTPVGKMWLKAHGRQFLIESVRHNSVLPELRKLPQLQATLPAQGGSRVALLSKMAAPMAGAPQPVRLAFDRSLLQRGPGLVLDYVVVEGESDDYTFRGDITYLLSGEVIFNGTLTLEGGTVIKAATSNDVVIRAYGNVITRGGPYRPIIITSQNDSSVGENLSSGSAPLKFLGPFLCSQNNLVFEHLRISYARYGLQTYNLKLKHAQFLNCDMALMIDTAGAEVDNVLFAKNGIAFGGRYFTAVGRHVTVNQTTNLSGGEWGGLDTSSLKLTNSLLVNVTSMGPVPLTTNYTVTTTASSTFQTAGAAAHYLAVDSSHRNAGTLIIPTTLAADLQTRTTFPPFVFSNAVISMPITLAPRVPRDTDTPDLGYHYDPLDYAFGGTDGNTNFTFAAGTAVGWFRTSSGWFHAGHGLHMADRQIVTFDGRADAPCYWVRCNMVQEGGTGAWDGGYGPGGITGWADQAAYDVTRSPEVHARYTRFSANGENHIRDDWGYIILRANHCEFWNGGLGGYINSLYLTNCLGDRLGFGNNTGWPGTGFGLRNCTFRAGSFIVNRYAGPMPISVRDTAFDSTIISVNDSHATNAAVSDYANNAFLTTGQRTTPTNINDVLVSSFNWQTGPLGGFYLPTNSTLINAGSRNATNAGLYHFVTTTNQVRETNTVVDIGYHYIAYNSSLFTNTVITTNISYATNVTLVTNQSITINDDGAASPYPAQLVVSNFVGTITSLKVTLKGLTHTWPGDIDMLMVLPSGRATMLMSDAGQSHSINNVTVTFDDAAPFYIPHDGLITNGSYKCTNYLVQSDSMPPYPLGFAGSIWMSNVNLSAFNGENPNGIWSLYIRDDTGLDAGSIANGWSLNINGTVFTNGVNTSIITNTVVVTNIGIVSIGILNSDGDGVADYDEDVDGDGSVESGETDWRSAADPGLRVYITRPRRQSIIP